MPVTEISRIPLDIGSKAILVQELYCINHEKCRRVINGAALIFIYLAKYLDFWIDSRGKLSIFSSIYKTFKSKKERYETQNIYILIISILKISIFEKSFRRQVNQTAWKVVFFINWFLNYFRNIFQKRINQ